MQKIKKGWPKGKKRGKRIVAPTVTIKQPPPVSEVTNPLPESNPEVVQASVAVESLPVEKKLVETVKAPETAKADLLKAERPVAKRKFTKRTFLLGLAGVMMVLGIVAFWLYAMTQNMIIGAPGVLLGVGGAALFYAYWNKTEGFIIETYGAPSKKQVNCLNIYRDAVVFEDYNPPGGKFSSFPLECVNDHKKYFINICPEIRKYSSNGDKSVQPMCPFILPDQQYYDPEVFAELLELPAHRRLFQRREKLGQVIKTALLVLTVLLIWILILTTTSNSGGSG